MLYKDYPKFIDEDFFTQWHEAVTANADKHYSDDDDLIVGFNAVMDFLNTFRDSKEKLANSRIFNGQTKVVLPPLNSDDVEKLQISLNSNSVFQNNDFFDYNKSSVLDFVQFRLSSIVLANKPFNFSKLYDPSDVANSLVTKLLDSYKALHIDDVKRVDGKLYPSYHSLFLSGVEKASSFIRILKLKMEQSDFHKNNNIETFRNCFYFALEGIFDGTFLSSPLSIRIGATTNHQKTTKQPLEFSLYDSDIQIEIKNKEVVDSFIQPLLCGLMYSVVKGIEYNLLARDDLRLERNPSDVVFSEKGIEKIKNYGALKNKMFKFEDGKIALNLSSDDISDAIYESNLFDEISGHGFGFSNKELILKSFEAVFNRNNISKLRYVFPDFTLEEKNLKELSQIGTFTKQCKYLINLKKRAFMKREKTKVEDNGLFNYTPDFMQLPYLYKNEKIEKEKFDFLLECGFSVAIDDKNCVSLVPSKELIKMVHGLENKLITEYQEASFWKDFYLNFSNSVSYVNTLKDLSLTLSIEQEDMLTASLSGYDWRSCHANSFSNTPVTLSANKVSFIAYVSGGKDNNFFGGKIDKKVMRAYCHYAEIDKDRFILSVENIYPSKKSHLANLISDKIIELITGSEDYDCVPTFDPLFGLPNLRAVETGECVSGYFDYYANTTTNYVSRTLYNELITPANELFHQRAEVVEEDVRQGSYCYLDITEEDEDNIFSPSFLVGLGSLDDYSVDFDGYELSSFYSLDPLSYYLYYNGLGNEYSPSDLALYTNGCPGLLYGQDLLYDTYYPEEPYIPYPGDGYLFREAYQE